MKGVKNFDIFQEINYGKWRAKRVFSVKTIVLYRSIGQPINKSNSKKFDSDALSRFI